MYVYIFLYLEIKKNSWVLRSKLHPGVNIWMFFFSSDQNSSFDLFSRIPDTKYKYYWWCSSFQYTVSTIRAIKRLAFYKTWIFSNFFPQKAPRRGLLEQKSGVLLELCQSGGLIESGLLFAQYIFCCCFYPFCFEWPRWFFLYRLVFLNILAKRLEIISNLCKDRWWLVTVYLSWHFYQIFMSRIKRTR